MDRTGFLAKIIESEADIYQGRQWMITDGRERAGRISYQDGLGTAMYAFRIAGAHASDDL
jgi:hypothetical protein